MPPRRSAKAPALVSEIVQRRLSKDAKVNTISQIARDLKMSRNTVKAVITESGIDQKLADTRGQLAELAPLAVESVKHHLENKNERVTLHYLDGIGAFSPDNGRNRGDLSLNVAIANLLPPPAQSKPIDRDAAIDAKVVESDPSTQNAGGDGKSNT